MGEMTELDSWYREPKLETVREIDERSTESANFAMFIKISFFFLSLPLQHPNGY